MGELFHLFDLDKPPLPVSEATDQPASVIDVTERLAHQATNSTVKILESTPKSDQGGIDPRTKTLEFVTPIRHKTFKLIGKCDESFRSDTAVRSTGALNSHGHPYNWGMWAIGQLVKDSEYISDGDIAHDIRLFVRTDLSINNGPRSEIQRADRILIWEGLGYFENIIKANDKLSKATETAKAIHPNLASYTYDGEAVTKLIDLAEQIDVLMQTYRRVDNDSVEALQEMRNRIASICGFSIERPIKPKDVLQAIKISKKSE